MSLALIRLIFFFRAIVQPILNKEIINKINALPKKCPYSELFWSEWGKMRTRITPNTDTFHAVGILLSAFLVLAKSVSNVKWKITTRPLNRVVNQLGSDDVWFLQKSSLCLNI